MRREVKKLIQGTTALAAPLLLRSRSTSLLVLMYHRVLPDGHPDREHEQAGMYVTPGTLQMHIDVLRRHFSLIHLDDWIQRRSTGVEVPRLACALTFDDGWLDNYQHAFPVLRQAAAPATIYLVSDLVGTGYAFWPNQLAQLLASPVAAGTPHGLPEKLTAILAGAGGSPGACGPMLPAQIDAVIGRCKQVFTDAEMQSMLADAVSRVAPAGGARRNLMNWDEIREMQATGLVRFGSHSRRHTRLLESLSREATRDEVIDSAEVIERETGIRPTTFCFPNGDHSAAAIAFARQGYSAATTTLRGWNSPDCDFHLLKRLGVHEDVSSTPAAFLSRIVGVG